MEKLFWSQWRESRWLVAFLWWCLVTSLTIDYLKVKFPYSNVFWLQPYTAGSTFNGLFETKSSISKASCLRKIIVSSERANTDRFLESWAVVSGGSWDSMHNNVRGTTDSGAAMWGEHLPLTRFNYVQSWALVTVDRDHGQFLSHAQRKKLFGDSKTSGALYRPMRLVGGIFDATLLIDFEIS